MLILLIEAKCSFKLGELERKAAPLMLEGSPEVTL